MDGMEKNRQSDYHKTFWNMMSGFEEAKQSFTDSGYDWNRIEDSGTRSLVIMIHELAANLGADEISRLLPDTFRTLPPDKKRAILEDMAIYGLSKSLKSPGLPPEAKNENLQKINMVAIGKEHFKKEIDGVIQRTASLHGQEVSPIAKEMGRKNPELVLQYFGGLIDKDAVKIIAANVGSSLMWQLDGRQIAEICSYFPKKPEKENLADYAARLEAIRKKPDIPGLDSNSAKQLIEEVSVLLRTYKMLVQDIKKRGKKSPGDNWDFEIQTTLTAVDIIDYTGRCSEKGTLMESMEDHLEEREDLEKATPHKVDTLSQMVRVVDENPNVKAVSFDLMDTLVYWKSHTIDRREEYFRKSVEILNGFGLGTTVEEFKHLRGYRTEADEKVTGLWMEKRLESARTGKEFRFKEVVRSIIEEICRRKKKTIPRNLVEKMSTMIQDAYVNIELATITLMPEAQKTLEELKKRKVKIALLSNAMEDEQAIRKYLTKLGIIGYFDIVKVSSEVGYQKNTRTTIFYDSLSRELGIPKHHIVHVGDNMDADYLGARKAGMMGIHFDKNPELKKILRRSKITGTHYKNEKTKVYANDLTAQRKRKINDMMAAAGIKGAETKEVGEMAARIYEISRDYYGQALMGLAADLLQDLKKNPDQLNMCLGRDSLPIFILQQMLLRYHGPLFAGVDWKRVQYLPVSRKLMGGEDKDSVEWREMMRREKPHVNTYSEDKLRAHLKSRYFDDYGSICVVDHGISGSTQNKLQKLYPKKYIKGKYLVSRIVSPEEKKKGYFVGYMPKRSVPGNNYDAANKAQFGEKFKKMKSLNFIRVMEDFFSGIQTSAEYFTGEEKVHKGLQYEKTNARNLGETTEERKRKLIKLTALCGMIDSVKLYGEDISTSGPEQAEKNVGKLFLWLKKLADRGEENAWISRDGALLPKMYKDAEHDIDAKLLKTLFRYKKPKS